VKTVINDRSRDEEVGTWVAQAIDVNYSPGDWAVGVECDGELVAGALLNSYNGSNIHGHLRVAAPYGMTGSFLHDVFELAFVTLGARRLTAPCAGDNVRVLTVLLKMGFICEAVLRDFLVKDDMYLMVMRPEHCKYLEKRHG